VAQDDKRQTQDGLAHTLRNIAGMLETREIENPFHVTELAGHISELKRLVEMATLQ
jgi:hypothetical protein